MTPNFAENVTAMKLWIRLVANHGRLCSFCNSVFDISNLYILLYIPAPLCTIANLQGGPKKSEPQMLYT